MAYLPWKLLACLGVGALVGWRVPNTFWLPEKLGESAAVYGGVLVFNGILLAVGWSAFAKIYEIISSAEFSSFLRRHNMLDLHIMFVEIVQIVLAAAAVVSFVGLVCLVVPVPLLASRILLMLMVGLSGYSIIQGMGASAMMHDLIWDKACWDAPDAPTLRAVKEG